jgi:hypothetical protein
MAGQAENKEKNIFTSNKQKSLCDLCGLERTE